MVCLKYCGSVTTSGRMSRILVFKSQTWVVSGLNPVSKLARDGPHTACWHWALRKTVPRDASPVDVGGNDLFLAVATEHRLQVVDCDEQDVERSVPGESCRRDRV